MSASRYYPIAGAYVEALAAKALPNGWLPCSDAPSDWASLKRHWRNITLMGFVGIKLPLKVYDGASDMTIFDRPEVNFAFRAHHDWAHLMTGSDFSFEGEAEAVRYQIEHLFTVYGVTPTTSTVASILQAEVVGQGEHLRRHGDFPKDQRGFVTAYLDRPEEALAKVW